MATLFFFLFFVVFFSQPPKKKKNRIAPSAAGKPQYLPVQFLSPHSFFSEGQKSHQFCQVSSLWYCHFVWVMSSEISLLSFLPSPAPLLSLSFLSFFFLHPLIKQKEMTLFSLHHGSNFPWLVPPALWRDPGHRAAGGRGKTERVAHPGKTDAHCGVIVLLALRTYALRTIPSGGWREKRPEKTPANVHMNCQGLNPSVWQLSPQPRIHPDVLRVVFVLFFPFFWLEPISPFSCRP